MPDDFPWPTIIIGAVAAIPIIGSLVCLALSSPPQGETSMGTHSNPGHSPQNTKCDVCGNKEPNWDRGWWVSDEEWLEIVPVKYQNKTLCPWCFIRFAEEKGKKYEIIESPPGVAAGVKVKTSTRHSSNPEKEEEEILSGNPEVKIDAKFESLRESKRRKWRGEGYPEGMIEKALVWAEEYSLAMASKITTDPDLRFRIEQELYPKSLVMAEKWIRGFLEFLK